MSYQNVTHFFSLQRRILVSVFCVVFFSIYGFVEASTLSIQTSENSISGEQVTVTIFIDPENIQINSVEASIVFSSEFLQYSGFNTTQSSIPLWVEKPQQKQEGIVRFSGVIPGGLERLYDPLQIDKKAIPLVQLFFITKKAGTTSLSVSNATVLQNDGKGTPTVVKTIPATLSIKERRNQDSAGIQATDTTPPEPFGVEIIERSVFGKTPRLAVFSATDRDGSISHYQVAIGSLDFVTTESPFPLPYKLFPYQITVRAVDYAGNIRDQHVTIPAEDSKNIGIAIVVGVALLVLIGFLRYRFYNRKKI